mgnify:CR=1 FL=1|jgi:hypothetical protein
MLMPGDAGKDKKVRIVFWNFEGVNIIIQLFLTRRKMYFDDFGVFWGQNIKSPPARS